MRTVFIESSVLFSASYSQKGYSRDLILMGIEEEIIIACSQLVLDETSRNLAEDAPDKLLFLEYIIEQIPFEFIEPTKREVLSAANRVALKDAPIVAAARKAKVDYLVTLDKKHLLGRPEIAKYVGAEIVTPKEVMDLVRGTN